MVDQAKILNYCRFKAEALAEAKSAHSDDIRASYCALANYWHKLAEAALADAEGVFSTSGRSSYWSASIAREH